jgi:hypothetical protein
MSAPANWRGDGRCLAPPATLGLGSPRAASVVAVELCAQRKALPSRRMPL